MRNLESHVFIADDAKAVLAGYHIKYQKNIFTTIIAYHRKSLANPTNPKIKAKKTDFCINLF